MADDDRYLTGEGEVDPEHRSAGYGTNTSFGPFSAGLILGGQEDAVPSIGGRFTAQLPEGLSATLTRTGQAGSRMADAANAITLAKQLESGQIGLTASRAGEHGLPSYSAQYSHPIGVPSKGGKPAGNWFAEAGMTPGTPERHIRGGAKFRFADGGHVEAAIHMLRHHFAEGGFLDRLLSGPDYLSTGEEVSPTNWGSPDVASDFFKADKALRLAREIQAKADTEARRPPIPDRVVEEAPALPRAAMRVAAEPSPSAKIMMLPDVGPYDFGQRVRGSQFREAPPHLTEQPGFGQTIAQGNKYADTTPEIVSRGLQRYAMPAAALTRPAKQAAIPGDIVALASDKIEGRVAPEADKIAARAPQGPELTDRDRDLIIRTIAAETSGKTPEESQAIAHVILNRIQSGNYGASPEAVLLAKKQFEPWSNPAGANYPMRFLPNSRRYGMGQAALEAALLGDDITGGALNFWGPKAQYALGRKAPSWAAEMPDYSDIGETRFHRPSADGGSVVERALEISRKG
jgi:spore germination cell wall hydrolase CwlJ-like protein